jgi:N-acyl-D-aspartate/D-glutamate deacylase
MSGRVVFAGGRVFDGTGAAPAEADVAVVDGRIVDVGPGLDGDEAIDVGGRCLLPGMFDCHVHMTFSDVDMLRMAQTPFSYRFFERCRSPC